MGWDETLYHADFGNTCKMLKPEESPCLIQNILSQKSEPVLTILEQA